MHEYRVLFHLPGAVEYRPVNLVAYGFEDAIKEAKSVRRAGEFIKSIEHIGKAH